MTTRYTSSSRYELSDDFKEAIRKETETTPYTVYTASEGETLDSIAVNILGDFSRYWEIADVNPQIKFPNRLSAGQAVRIPR